ncbi:MAG: flavin reductase [Bacteroidetes bacterium]|nr:flavin reductase [Bacteroidota bacterium]MBU1719640.1 flavin reductase [Bacteroidota bacterium]
MNRFRISSPYDLKINPFQAIGNDWILITAGTPDSFNTMTAAWAGLGVLWKKPVAWIYIRPQRFTYQFTEKYDDFTLCFFPEKFRDALSFCGTHSGRDTDKIAATGLEPIATDKNNIIFAQADIALECRKLFYQDVDNSNFLDPAIEKLYPLKDYHRLYIGEITGCFQKP